MRKFERKERKDEWVRENNEGKHVLISKIAKTAAAQSTYPPRRKYLISGTCFDLGLTAAADGFSRHGALASGFLPIRGIQ